MPIKLPKGFQRRKSSGNALDEVHNPPVSSFRVIERPGSKSLDGGRVLRSAGAEPPSHNGRTSFEQDEEDLFSVARPDAMNRCVWDPKPPPDNKLTRHSGSGGTENSIPTSQYDSAASSTRLSTSTNPSSIDTRSDRNVQAPFKDIPVPPQPSARPGFLRNSARTFSLGVGIRSSKEAASQPQPHHHNSSPTASPAPAIHPANLESRGRAMTASSASTATPPKLFDSDLALNNSELDAFGNMFDGIGLKSSRDASPGVRNVISVDFGSCELTNHAQNLSSSPPVPASAPYPPTSYPLSNPSRVSRAPPPNPIRTTRHDYIESSPYSWTSQDSRDGLMRSPSPSKTITQNSPPTRVYGSASTTTPRTVNRKPMPIDKGLDLPTESRSQFFSHSGADESLLKVSSYQSAQSDQEDAFDPTLLASADLANRYQEQKPTNRPVMNNKVMTRAQFEKYRQQQEMDRRLGASADSDSEGEADNYEDDDDDLEMEKLAAKQRRKQEAHLAVYRQQMMKVTGDQAPQRSASSLSNTLDPRSISTPDLNRLSNVTASTLQSSKSSADEEEDEDVPLGILAAHGFPNRNRPPTQLMSSSSNPNLRASAQLQPAAQSVAGTESTKRVSTLPVFARQLPQDPYYGASLVNQSNRESLAIHNPSSAAMAGSGASTLHPHHPAGLVGVIAGEEKARAMRRGSPNAQANFDLPPSMQHPGMARSQTTGNIPQMPFPPGMMPPMPMMSPGDQAQIQMSQQMTQMMQMQMQWMQQMTQMMGGQAPPGQQMPPMMPPGQMPNSFLTPQGGPSRPQSIAPMSGQRTMSTLGSAMANWNLGQGGNYTHSIAPSERSNVGLASRYRPVSVAPDPEPLANKRASTFTSSSVRPWTQSDQSQRLSSFVGRPALSPVGRKSPLGGDEEDDEQGWAEMKAKKDKKHRTWKMKKEQNTLKELYNEA